MSTLSEKRVYAEQGEPTPVYVAAEQGLVRAKLSGDSVGEFSLARRCTALDVALGDEGLLALATPAATLVGGDAAELRETGFGTAVAVSFGAGSDSEDAALVAVGKDGTVATLSLDTVVGGEPTAADWATLGTVDAGRAADGGLLAAADGVYRVRDGHLDAAGLDDALDVAARGAPLAATGDGLYELGNGWMVATERAHETVATDGQRAHAVDAEGTLYARDGREWTQQSIPLDAEPADVGYTEDGVVVVTTAGDLLVDIGDGWRSRALGVTGVSGIAVPRDA